MVHTRTKIFASIAGAVCLASVLSFVAFEYVLMGLKASLLEQEKSVFDARVQESRFAALERLVNETEAERAELKTLILSDEGVVDFLALIEALGAERGAKLKTNTLTVIPGGDRFEELKMNLTVEGSEENVLHILRLLEVLPFRSVVDTVGLSHVSKGSSGDVWQGTFDVRVTKYKKI